MKLFSVVAVLLLSLSLCNFSGNLGNSGNQNANANTDQTANRNNDDADASPEANTNSSGTSDTTATTLRELLDVENEWTEANNRADREALERILADEFLGTDPAGTVTNKQEYISTIQPNNSMRSWDFDDLNLTQSGTNSVLTGILIVNGQQGNQRFTQRYRFTDTFIRRDGRWQAISSQVMEMRPPAAPPRRPNDRRRDDEANRNMI